MSVKKGQKLTGPRGLNRIIQNEFGDTLHWCSTEQLFKKLEEFSCNAGSSSGYDYDCKSCTKKQHALPVYRTKARETIMIRKYNVTLSEYEAMLAQQDGGCAICNTKESKCYGSEHFAVDHDHNTGKVRGLLCSNCNVALGLFKDSKELLVQATDYLTRNQ